MSDDVVSMVTKEEIFEGWYPAEGVSYYHRLSNEMRDFTDKKNIGHDLVLSDSSRHRVKTKNVNVALREYLWNRSVVAICEAFLPVHDSLTKTMRKKIRVLAPNDPLKDHFDEFFNQFKVAVLKNGREVKLKKGGMWPAKLTFADFSVGLEKVKLYFGDDESLKTHVEGLQQFYASVVKFH